MAKILFVYSTIDGHTLEICERLGQIVERAGHDAVLTELSADSVPQLVDYDRVVIGASIRYGKHRPEVARFINDNVASMRLRANQRKDVRIRTRMSESSSARFPGGPSLLKFSAAKLSIRSTAFGTRP
jgi:menaquinone-dependent protoporphyrinogen oxidase